MPAAAGLQVIENKAVSLSGNKLTVVATTLSLPYWLANICWNMPVFTAGLEHGRRLFCRKKKAGNVRFVLFKKNPQIWPQSSTNSFSSV
jgi:hypothetical protein